MSCDGPRRRVSWRDVELAGEMATAMARLARAEASSVQGGVQGGVRQRRGLQLRHVQNVINLKNATYD